MPKNKVKSEDRCTHLRADGKRCALPRAKGHDSFCFHHWRSEENLSDRASRSPEAGAYVAEALGSISQLNTTTAVNDALAKLFTLRARKLISSRDTVVLSYVIQLLLQTLRGAHDEFTRLYEWHAWDKILESAIQDVKPQLAGLRLRKRKRPTRLPETRREFAEQVLTDYALGRGLIQELPEGEDQAEIEEHEVEEREEVEDSITSR